MRNLLCRAATLGDGWLPWQTTLREMKSAVAYIYEQPAMQVRSRPFEIFTLLAEIPEDDRLNFLRRGAIRRTKKRLSTWWAGCRKPALRAWSPPAQDGFYEECLDWVRWFSHEIIPLHWT
ncbi:MAG: hypothetical protein IPI06_16030 [Gammaproteobacteria bacterium]|nr:hypothetical protein [Gammaproteobacteria bacterium]